MILFILFLALALRFIKLDQSLWLDEAINVLAVKSNSYLELITKYSIGDFHPPLYHIVLKTTVMFLGSSELIVRMPSVMFGVGAVYLTYLIGKELYDKKTGIIAGILIATSPLHIYYSQEARMYSLAAFCATLSVYFFLRVLKNDNLLNWAGFITSSALMLYSDYLPYLLLPIYFIFLLFNKNKFGIVKTSIPAFFLIFIFLLPWLYLLPSQLKTGLSAAQNSPAWAKVVGAPNFKDIPLTFTKFTIGRISHSNDLIYALIISPIALFIASMFLSSIFRVSYKRLFLYLWLFVPLMLAFIIGYLIPIYSYFRFIFLLPAFYLIIASGINTIRWPKWNRITLFIMLAINFASLTIFLTDKKFQREDWKSATSYVQQNLQGNSIVLFESAEPFSPFIYYSQGKIPAAGALRGFNAQENETEIQVSKITYNKNQVFLFQYLQGITDPQGLVFESLTNQSFVNTKTVDFPGVGFIYEFVKTSK